MDPATIAAIVYWPYAIWGIVAAVTFAAAAAADLLLSPAMCRLLQPDARPEGQREPADCRGS